MQQHGHHQPTYLHMLLYALAALFYSPCGTLCLTRYGCTSVLGAVPCHSSSSRAILAGYSLVRRPGKASDVSKRGRRPGWNASHRIISILHVQ
ncbi:hypothetical protein V8C34DRAFT_283058 [Trichoderma compactum]